MQSLKPVRERKINKAHREIINNDSNTEIKNEKVSISTEKKKEIHHAERKRKRISAQNEIVIPNLDEKYKISINPSPQKKTIVEEAETSKITKPKKYYDQEEIRKYMKEKKLNRKKSHEELDQVVPEKPKSKSYNVNEVRDFMRKKLKAREEQHKKEMLDKEKKKNEIKQRLDKLKEFQKKQMNNHNHNHHNNNNKEKSKSHNKISKLEKAFSHRIKGKEPLIQKNNYLSTLSDKNNNKVIVINKFENSNASSTNYDTYSSESIYEHDLNNNSFLDNSEYENIPTKINNDSYYELSKISGNNMTDNYFENISVTNFSEDYSIESLQSQAKRIQDLIKNAEVLAQRIEHHTTKKTKVKENTKNKLDGVSYGKKSLLNSFNDSLHESTSSSSSSYLFNSQNITPTQNHLSNIKDKSNTNILASLNKSYHETSKLKSHPSLVKSKIKTTPINEDGSKKLSQSIQPSSSQNLHSLSISQSIGTHTKNKLKEKEPSKTKTNEDDIYLSEISQNQAHEDSVITIDDMSIDETNDLSIASTNPNSEMKLDDSENITPQQWNLNIDSNVNKGDNYSTINIFTRRFQPSKKNDIKKKTDSSSIYKKIIEKMEEKKEEQKPSSTETDTKYRNSTVASPKQNETKKIIKNSIQ
jgi:hypothetical protein